VHCGVVCRVARLVVCWLTPASDKNYFLKGDSGLPSMMSISPPCGHGPFWLVVQKAGQVLTRAHFELYREGRGRRHLRAALWHMLQVQDDDGVRVSLLGTDSDGTPSSRVARIQGTPVIGFHDESVPRCYRALRCCRCESTVSHHKKGS
jgi:hypothetical protein